MTLSKTEPPHKEFSENFVFFFIIYLVGPHAVSTKTHPDEDQLIDSWVHFLVQCHQHNVTVITLSRIKWIYVFGLGWNQLDTFVKEMDCVCVCVTVCVILF